MSPSELKYAYETQSGGHFFDRKTMKFFGDTMKNYGVRSVVISASFSNTNQINCVEAWELYRKNPVKNGEQDSTYFSKKNFSVLHKIG